MFHIETVLGFIQITFNPFFVVVK